MTVLQSLDTLDMSELVEGADGSLWGTGLDRFHSTCWVVAVTTPGGSVSMARDFDIDVDGCPNAKLTRATDGNFYGMGSRTGVPGPLAIFRLTPRGQLTFLRDLGANFNVGPANALVQGPDGHFYGSTLNLGDSRCFRN